MGEFSPFRSKMLAIPPKPKVCFTPRKRPLDDCPGSPLSLISPSTGNAPPSWCRAPLRPRMPAEPKSENETKLVEGVIRARELAEVAAASSCRRAEERGSEVAEIAAVYLFLRYRRQVKQET